MGMIVNTERPVKQITLFSLLDFVCTLNAFMNGCLVMPITFDLRKIYKLLLLEM